MPRMASNSLRRRIGRIQRQTANAGYLRSGPSEGLLDLLAKLNTMTKKQLHEVQAWRDGVGGHFGGRRDARFN